MESGISPPPSKPVLGERHLDVAFEARLGVRLPDAAFQSGDKSPHF